MRFVVDSMLGKLARWLRLSGYDVTYGKLTDEEILKKAEKESRVIVTRDKLLYIKANSLGLKCILIKSNELKIQLLQLIEELGIAIYDSPEKSRCPICGGELRDINREEIRKLVPKKVFESVERFFICESCNKIYWEGNHWKKIKEMVKCIKSLAKRK